MGNRKDYNAARCPSCDTQLIVKHSKNGKYNYCTYCETIVTRKTMMKTEPINYELAMDPGRFKSRKQSLKMR